MLVQRVQRPDRHHVVRREDRLRHAAREQGARQLVPGPRRPVAGRGRRPLQAQLRGRLAEAVEAGAGVVPVRRAGQVGDRAHASACEVLDHRMGAEALVHAHDLGGCSRRGLRGDGEDGDRGGRRRDHRLHPLVRRDHEDPVDARADQLGARRRPRRVPGADRRQQHRVARLAGRGLDRGDRLGGAEQRGAVGEQADLRGARGLQSAGGAVRGVAGLRDRREHPLPGLGADDAGLVEHAGDRLIRDPGAACDVGHRRAARRWAHGVLLADGRWSGTLQGDDLHGSPGPSSAGSGGGCSRQGAARGATGGVATS